ncbi:MAG: hypothetical protein K6E54_09330 [Bacteroidaceae bacterium]|nr:hypothetical protein [Bacteroidaceae bacterium]
MKQYIEPSTNIKASKLRCSLLAGSIQLTDAQKKAGVETASFKGTLPEGQSFD